MISIQDLILTLLSQKIEAATPQDYQEIREGLEASCNYYSVEELLAFYLKYDDDDDSFMLSLREKTRSQLLKAVDY